jgi:hypothetical protein
MDDELRWRLWMIARLGDLPLRAVSLYLRPVKDETQRIRRMRKITLAMSVFGLGALLRET